MSIEMKKFEGFHVTCGEETAFYTKDGTPIFTVIHDDKMPELDPMAAAPLADETLYQHLRLLKRSRDEATTLAHSIPVMNHIKWQQAQIARLELEIRFNKSIAQSERQTIPERPTHMEKTIEEMSK